jgi:hypothetical protein
MKIAAILIPIAILSSCTTLPADDPQQAFFARLSALCGQAFDGRIASPPVDADRDFAGRRLTMHVRDCSASEIRIPFRVGDDRSRTWVIRRPAGGPRGAAPLTLSHDHRHGDGSEDRLSRYGGAAIATGTSGRQEFPADEFSRTLFARENIPQSATNVWALEVRPGAMFAYELRRPGRFFRVEFDLAHPTAPPA